MRIRYIIRLSLVILCFHLHTETSFSQSSNHHITQQLKCLDSLKKREVVIAYIIDSIASKKKAARSIYKWNNQLMVTKAYRNKVQTYVDSVENSFCRSLYRTKVEESDTALSHLYQIKQSFPMGANCLNSLCLYEVDKALAEVYLKKQNKDSCLTCLISAIRHGDPECFWDIDFHFSTFLDSNQLGLLNLAYRQEYLLKNPGINVEKFLALISLMKTDMKIRFYWEKYEPIMSPFQRDSVAKKWSESDSLNHILLAETLGRYGWFDKETTGLFGPFHGFLLLLHAPVEIQLKYLPYAVQDYRNDDPKFDQNPLPSGLRGLVDKILVAKGRKQLYGTQFGPERSVELEDMKNEKAILKELGVLKP